MGTAGARAWEKGPDGGLGDSRRDDVAGLGAAWVRERPTYRDGTSSTQRVSVSAVNDVTAGGSSTTSGSRLMLSVPES